MIAFHRLFIFVFVIVASASAVAGQTPCSRYSNAGSGFSICLPGDWTRSDVADDAFPHFIAAGQNAGAAYLNFAIAKTAAPLADYVTEANKKVLEHIKEIGFDSLSLVSRTEFVTSSKEHGVLLIYTGTSKGLGVRVSQYYFDLSQSQKTILTFTYKEGIKSLNDQFFETVAATFQLEK